MFDRVLNTPPPLLKITQIFWEASSIKCETSSWQALDDIVTFNDIVVNTAWGGDLQNPGK